LSRLPFSRRHISTLITVIILCQVDPLSVPRVDQLVTETITGVVRQRRRKDFPSCFIRRHIGTVIISFSATEYHFRLLKADPEVSLSHLIGRSNGQWVQRVRVFCNFVHHTRLSSSRGGRGVYNVGMSPSFFEVYIGMVTRRRSAASPLKGASRARMIAIIGGD
jgi:hypothetical protein